MNSCNKRKVYLFLNRKISGNEIGIKWNIIDWMVDVFPMITTTTSSLLTILIKETPTVIVEAKNKGSVTYFDEKLLDIDKALFVDYLDSNLNLSEPVAVSGEIGKELGDARIKDGMCRALPPSLSAGDSFVWVVYQVVPIKLVTSYERLGSLLS